MSMRGVIRWEEPPPYSTKPRGPGRVAWAIVAQQLRDRPGEWAVVYEGSQNSKLLQRITNGSSPWFQPKGAYEGKQRVNPDTHVATVYARYVGGEPR